MSFDLARTKDFSRGSLALLIAYCLVNCSNSSNVEPNESNEPVLLAPLSGLEVIDSADDPLADHRPEAVDCSRLTGWFIESIDSKTNVLEANTGECNYLAVAEPAATSARAGDTLLTELSYFDLTAAEPSEAHVALTVRNVVIWESTIPIPSDADVRKLRIALPEPVAEGDLIGFHLHNHGQNSWNFNPIFVERKSDPE